MSRPDGRLEGKVALVTGAGSGVGRAIAAGFAREGARVGLMGRRKAPLAAAARAIQAAGGEALVVPGDVAAEQDTRRAVTAVTSRYGRLDLVVNNAGLYSPAGFAETTRQAWEETLAVNLTGPFLLVRAAWAELKRARGVVIQISSTIGLRPVPGAAAYCVSKAALDMLTRVLALEGAPHGIRAHSILLGIVDTPIHRARPVADRKAWSEAVDRMHPLGRMGKPEDVVGMAVHLGSAEAAWTTGGLYLVDGGISLV